MWFLTLAALTFIGEAVAVPQLHHHAIAPLRPLKETENTIPGEYIVVFKRVATEYNMKGHMFFLNNMLEHLNGTYRVQHVYDMGPSFRGYAVSMNDQMLESVRGRWEVDYVERNQRGEWSHLEKTDELMYHAEDLSEDPNFEDKFEQYDELQELVDLDEEDWEQLGKNRCRKQQLTNENWALSRISHKNIQSGQLVYRYKRSSKLQGKNVYIYIIDSGIDVNNTDFGGRAEWGINLSGGPNVDSIGHGTRVAGCAMSNTYGVAKKARAVAVGIEQNGAPTTALAIAAFEWVQKNKKRKSVANGSFTVSGQAVNAAAESLVDSGVPVVIAAGNNNRDACLFYPASSPKVITVAASDRDDNFASFSNFGECVNITAPGVAIQTTGTNNQNPVTAHGTSFAAPYTSGVVATILGKRKMKPARVAKILYKRAVSGKIKNAPQGTINRLLNSRC